MLLDARNYEDAPKKIGAYEGFYEVTKNGEMMNLNEKSAWITDTRAEQGEYLKDLQERWQTQFIRKNMKTNKEGQIYSLKTGTDQIFKDEAEFKAHITGPNHIHIDEEKEAVVFKSKTFALVMQDSPIKPTNLLEGHMNTTEEDLKNLEILKG